MRKVLVALALALLPLYSYATTCVCLGNAACVSNGFARDSIAAACCTGSGTGTCTGTCDTAADANWQGGGACATGANGPDATDIVVAMGGGTVTISEAAPTFVAVRALYGGTIQRSGTAFQTLTLTGSGYWGSNPVTNGATVGNMYAYIESEPGSMTDFSATATRPQMDIVWTGDRSTTGCGGGACPTDLYSVHWIAGNVSNNFNNTADAIIKWNGQEKIAGAVMTYYGAGLTTTAADWIDCAIISATPSATICTAAATPDAKCQAGDTIVFTSGKSDGFWYKIVPLTAECTNLCDTDGDGPDDACTHQIQRNVTGTGTARDAAYNSVLLGTGYDRANNAYHATPLDSDANGTADSTGTMPAPGDSFTIFSLARLYSTTACGTGVADCNGGASIGWHGAQAAVRYVELGRSASSRDICRLHHGTSPFWMEVVAATWPTGDFGFFNVHDMMGEGAMELQITDRADDQRPNYGYNARYWYIHDRPDEVETCNGGAPTTQYRIGGGITLVQDYIAGGGSIENVTLDHFHFARLGGGNVPAFGTTNEPSSACVGGSNPGDTCDSQATCTGGGACRLDTTKPQWKNITFSNAIVHDWPKTATYPTAGVYQPVGVLAGLSGVNMTLTGASVWDVGSTTSPGFFVSLRPMTTDDVPGESGHYNSLRVSNGWVVNIDSNDSGVSNGSVASAMYGIGTPSLRHYVNSGVARFSDNYFSNIVGTIGAGGEWYYNFIRNSNISNGAAACDAGNQRAFYAPVDFVGNVVTYDPALTAAKYCGQSAIVLDDKTPFGYTSGKGSQLTTRTRKWTSNYLQYGKADNSGNGVIYLLDRATAGLCNGVDETCESANTDIYNNVINANRQFELSSWGTTPPLLNLYNYGAWSTTEGRINAYYNVFEGFSEPGGGYAIYTSGTHCGAVPQASCYLNSDYNLFLNYDSPAGTAVMNQPNAGGHDVVVASTVNGSAPAALTLRAQGDLPPWLDCASPYNYYTAGGSRFGPLRYGLNSFSAFHPAVLPLMSTAAYAMRYNWQDCQKAYQDAIPR